MARQLAGGWLLAGLAGAAAGLALPPQGWPWLLWPALAVLWELGERRRSGPCLLWGLAAVLVSHRWMLALHPLDWVGVPAPLSLPLAVGLWFACGLLGATLVGLWALLVRRLAPSDWLSALFLAGLWGSAEVLLARSPLFWLGVGAAALPADPPLAGLAALMGEGGLASLQVAIAWSLRSAWRQLPQRRAPLLAWLVAVALIHAVGAAAPWPRSRPLGPPLQVVAHQPAIPTREKFRPEQRRRLRRGLAAAQAAAIARGADLVVVPEGALDAGEPRPEPLGVELLSGGFRRQGAELRSSLLRFPPGSPGPAAAVDKHRLVPLGEWLPRGRWWTWAGLSAVGGVSPGPAPRLLPRPGAAPAVAICYEISDGEAAAAAVRRGASWQLAVANLDPYPPQLRGQFTALARLRALELGRPLLVVANTGPTLALDAAGEPGEALPAGRAGVLALVLQPRSGLTPYAGLGSLPLLLLTAVSGAAVASRSIRPPPSTRSPS